MQLKNNVFYFSKSERRWVMAFEFKSAGRTNTEIAQILKCSPKSAKRYLKNYDLKILPILKKFVKKEVENVRGQQV